MQVFGRDKRRRTLEKEMRAIKTPPQHKEDTVKLIKREINNLSL